MGARDEYRRPREHGLAPWTAAAVAQQPVHDVLVVVVAHLILKLVCVLCEEKRTRAHTQRRLRCTGTGIYVLPRFHSKRHARAGISQLAWRSNLAIVALPMGAIGPMQLGLARLEAAER